MPQAHASSGPSGKSVKTPAEKPPVRAADREDREDREEEQGDLDESTPHVT
jgi:hypothetical protein